MATTVAKRTPSQELVGRIRSEDFKNQVALALPAGVSPDRFVRATVTALMQNPDIVKAERESLQGIKVGLEKTPAPVGVGHRIGREFRSGDIRARFRLSRIVHCTLSDCG
jgi:penicillin V acylase-like amidase (Ntn superfamily)